MKKAVIIGGGIGGLGTACLLAKQGYEVTLLEKNARLGGRANVFEANGYRFDMGPSWYLMPDVFEHFFSLLGEKIEDHLTLTQLSPSYRIFFEGTNTHVDLEADINKAAALFETLEAGSGEKLKEYVEQSKYQYEIATREFMYKNYNSFLDFFNKRTMVEGRKLSILKSMDSYVKKFFASDKVQKIMQYQLVFLGSSPYKTPALYNIMSHIDFNMGVFYPKGGIYSLVESLASIARKHGTVLRTDSEVRTILTTNSKATGVKLMSGEVIPADLVISNADIAYTDRVLTPPGLRTFSERYWKKRTLAPSAFILYLGIDGKIDTLTHHNLIFANDWQKNFAQIFDTPGLPSKPSLYVCCPSRTDDAVAPAGKENLFVLVPIGAGVTYTDEQLAAYKDQVLETMEKEMNIPNLRNRIEFERMYSLKDFENDYHSLGGSALGLAHTLTQTATMRPNNVSKKIPNLYYVGAGTNPGIGMPICLISAELAYKRIANITTPEPLTSLPTQEAQ
jgi:phytoene desaturase